MSPFTVKALSLVNRNLQVTLAAGAALFAAIAATPELLELMPAFTPLDLTVLISLAGLPIMLFVRADRRRSLLERAMAVATAVGLCILGLLYAAVIGGLPIIVFGLPFCLIALLQTTYIQRDEERRLCE